MYKINEDLSIYVTRGDTVLFDVKANDADGTPHTFMPGDLVRIKVYKKKKAEEVVLQKDFHITTPTQKVQIYLSKEDTKIGEVISKPVTYWYSIALINPDNEEQTIIGYDDETGAKTFVLLPEGGDKVEEDNEQEVTPPENVDNEIDINSTRPVSNQAVARLENRLTAAITALADKDVTPQFFGAVGDGEADDTEAFQKMFDYMASLVSVGSCEDVDGGGIIHYGRTCRVTIPKGTYNVNGVTISSNYIDIEGDNAIIKSTGKAFVIDGGWKTVISGLIFVNCETAIELNGENQEMGNLNIENCEFIGCTSHGINITYKQSYLGVIENCRFFKCQYAIEQHNCDLMIVRNCWISEFIRTKDYDSTIISQGGELQIDSCLFVPYPNSNNKAEPCWIDGNSNVVITKSHFGAEAGSKPMIRAMSTNYRYTITDCIHAYTANELCMVLVSGGFQGITIANCKTFYDNMVPVRISNSVTDASKLTTNGSFIYFENLYGNRSISTYVGRWGLIPPEFVDYYVGEDKYKMFYPCFAFENNYGAEGVARITSTYGETFGSSLFNGLGEFGIKLYCIVNETATNKNHACIVNLLPSTIKGTYQTTYTAVVEGVPNSEHFVFTYNNGTHQNTGAQLDFTIAATNGYRSLSVKTIESLYVPQRQSAIYPI